MNPSELERLSSWASQLRLGDIPDRVREHAKNQVFSMLAAVHSGFASDLGAPLARCFPWRSEGASTVIPTGEATDPLHAAALMSACSMVLDYDDVMLGGHTGHASVLVPLAFAGVDRLTGEDLLLAQITANEVSARINMAVALGPTRGQMATHLPLLGAATARAKILRLEKNRFAHALALALSYPGKILYPAFLGSDAKSLCAAWPIIWGIEASEAALGGLNGNLEALETSAGFLHQAVATPCMEFLSGLGERWHTETNSYKMYPGSAYLQAPVEAAATLVARTGLRVSEVQHIDVYVPLLTAGMDAHSQPYLDGPRSSISTLSFFTPFAVACALQFGSFQPAHLRWSVRTRGELWDLAGRIRIHHDVDLTVDALRCGMPIGCALSSVDRMDRLRFLLSGGNRHPGGQRVPLTVAEKLEMLTRLCLPPRKSVPSDFSHLQKRLGARVVVTLESGRVETQAVSIPQGFAGSVDASACRRLVIDKYRGTALETIGAGAAAESIDQLERLEQLSASEIDRLIRLNTKSETLGSVSFTNATEGIPACPLN